MVISIPIAEVLLESGIRTGFSFRERVENDLLGEVAVVQMKDLRQGYLAIDYGSLSKVSGRNIPHGHYLKQGDVLLLSKGQNNRAVVFDLAESPAVAASAFFVLRPDLGKIDPGYLAWWINQGPVQQHLHENMAGTYIPNITKPVVEGITVPLPPLEQQRRISTVHGLAMTEHRIMDELRVKRQQLVDQVLSASIRTQQP